MSIFGVAHAKALHFATLGGSSLHEPSYEGRLRVYIRDLVADANAGKLGVCSQHGKIGSVEEVLAEAKEHMVEPLDDPDMTIALNVWVSLRQLNDWAALTGDLFTISHDALWLDERGWMNVHGVPPKLSFKIDLAPDLPQLADPQGQKNAAFVEAESASGGVTTAPLPLTSGDIGFASRLALFPVGDVAGKPRRSQTSRLWTDRLERLPPVLRPWHDGRLRGLLRRRQRPRYPGHDACRRNAEDRPLRRTAIEVPAGQSPAQRAIRLPAGPPRSGAVGSQRLATLLQ